MGIDIKRGYVLMTCIGVYIGAHMRAKMVRIGVDWYRQELIVTY